MSPTELSPWIAVAGLGALHGLLPAGWLCVAPWTGAHAEPVTAGRAMIAVALGHGASLALVAGAALLAISRGWSWPTGAAWTAGVIALGLGLLWAGLRPRPRRARWPASLALALGVFVLSSAQGSGLMLLPVGSSLCWGDGAMRQIAATGSAARVVAAVALHLAAMLAAAGLGAVLGRWLRARPVFRLRGAQRAAGPSGWGRAP